MASAPTLRAAQPREVVRPSLKLCGTGWVMQSRLLERRGLQDGVDADQHQGDLGAMRRSQSRRADSLSG